MEERVGVAEAEEELRQAISICLNCFQTCHLAEAEKEMRKTLQEQ